MQELQKKNAGGDGVGIGENQPQAIRIDDDIATLDLECIAYKACKDEGWSLEYTDSVELQYRAFLQAVRNLKESASDIAPTKDVDRFWHHHILDTQKYITDCDRVFGFYLHHYPYSGIFGHNDEETQNKRFLAGNNIIGAILGTKHYGDHK